MHGSLNTHRKVINLFRQDLAALPKLLTMSHPPPILLGHRRAADVVKLSGTLLFSSLANEISSYGFTNSTDGRKHLSNRHDGVGTGSDILVRSHYNIQPARDGSRRHISSKARYAHRITETHK